MPRLIQCMSHALDGLLGRSAAASLATGESVRLVNRLGRLSSDLDTASHVLSPDGARAPRHVNAQTLLGPELRAASLLKDGTVLMASPLRRDWLDYAMACVTHKVARVVDVRSNAEKRGLFACPLDGGDRPFSDSRGTVRFSRQGAAVPVHGTSASAAGDRQRSVQIRLSRGAPARGPGNQRSEPRLHSLNWIRVHVASGEEIPPQRLLDISLHLAMVLPASGGKTIFQCAQGQHTGATFAAAHALLQRHLRDPLRTEDIEAAVLAECLHIRADRGLELFRAEDLGALVAYAHLMLDADRRGALPRGKPAPPIPPRASGHRGGARPSSPATPISSTPRP